MKQVYLSMSTDVIHNGHIRIIQNAAALGEVTVGVLTDEAVYKYKRFPALSYSERAEIIANIKGVSRVVKQEDLDYKENLLKYKPDIVVHGDNWRTGVQAEVRERVLEILNSYGGELVEFPYSNEPGLAVLEGQVRRDLNMPENRRALLRKLLQIKKPVTVMEAHSGLTGLIVENTIVTQNGEPSHFDAMWLSSLCDSTIKGKPDIEVVDYTSRMNTVHEIMEVTTKPIIFDGDTGGLSVHFRFLVQTLERLGVSAVIIEDKTGLKKNSLFGTEVRQTQADISEFCEKIREGQAARKTKDFMIIARIESLILEAGMDDALTRARAYVDAGADGIMIHSRKKEPDEIFEFCRRFRQTDRKTVLVVVPTTFNSVTESVWAENDVNIVIYANQFIRAAFPAMKEIAETILKNHRAQEADQLCMPVNEIIRLIPGND